MGTKEELQSEINQKLTKLELAQLESNALNSGKYKDSSNAKISEIFANALVKEIQVLRNKLESL